MLGRPAVEMRADRDGAVGEGAAQPEVEAGAHVLGRPVGLAVGARRLERGVKSAVGIGGARPDVPFVQVGVQVDQARPDLAAVLVDQGGVTRVRRAPRRADPGNPAALDVQIDQRQLPAGIGEVAIEQTERHARVGDFEVVRGSSPAASNTDNPHLACLLPVGLCHRAQRSRTLSSIWSGVKRCQQKASLLQAWKQVLSSTFG